MNADASVLARVPELRETFAREGRVVIEDLLSPGDTESIARELRGLPFVRVVNKGATLEQPRYDNFFYIADVDPMRPLTPLRAFVRSVARGALRDLVASITGRPGLFNREGKKHRPVLVAHAYRRGGHLGPHDDRAIDESGRRSVALVWHGSQTWSPEWGGQLHFVESGERLTPKLGTLHLFDVIARNRHEVTPVRGPETRYSLGGWLYELP